MPFRVKAAALAELQSTAPLKVALPLVVIKRSPPRVTVDLKVVVPEEESVVETDKTVLVPKTLTAPLNVDTGEITFTFL